MRAIVSRADGVELAPEDAPDATEYAVEMRRFDEAATLAAALASVETAPRVFVAEWLEPPYTAGHWVPDMVDTAGGDNLFGASGQPSQRTTWDALDGCDADVVVAALCGFDLPAAVEHLVQIADDPGWRALTAGAHVVAVDGSAYFSRPGPRLTDGVELLAWVLHGVGPRPPSGRAAALRGGSWVDVADHAPLPVG